MAEAARMRIEPVASCEVSNVRSLWRNGPHWHTVWPHGASWCYQTAEQAADRAIEVTEFRTRRQFEGTFDNPQATP